MTVEKRCLIETGDIIAVQYECGKCHGAMLIPIERIDPERIAVIGMNACPHCGTPSGLQPSTIEMKAFLNFNTALKQIAGAMVGRNLKLRLEVKAPE